MTHYDTMVFGPQDEFFSIDQDFTDIPEEMRDIAEERFSDDEP